MQGVIATSFDNLSNSPLKNRPKCDSWLKDLDIFIFDILLKMNVTVNKNYHVAFHIMCALRK